MMPNKLALYFVADMVVADIDFLCGQYGFLLWPIWFVAIWSHPFISHYCSLQKVCLTIWVAFFFIRTLKLGTQILSPNYPKLVSGVV